MADGKTIHNRQDSTAVDISEALSDGGNKRSSLATELTTPMVADGNPNAHLQDSTDINFPNSGIHGSDIPDNIGNIITSGSSNSSVSEGLYSLISSVMTGFDARADATSSSQDQLAFALDRLTLELDKLLEDAPSPFIMQHAARISVVRKRVKALNTVLKSVQRQIDTMDRMMSAGIVHEKLMGESSGQQPAFD